MKVTRHAQVRGQERMGVDMIKFARLLRSQGLKLPQDGNIKTEFGTLIVQNGALVTVLEKGMVAV